MKIFSLIAQLSSVYCFEDQGLTMTDIQKLENGSDFYTIRRPRSKFKYFNS